jgi:hypothetical protein
MVAQFIGLFRCEIRFFGSLEVFLHLFYDMFGFMKVLNIQVRRGLDDLLRVPALGTELPFLEAIHVRERPA